MAWIMVPILEPVAWREKKGYGNSTTVAILECLYVVSCADCRNGSPANTCTAYPSKAQRTYGSFFGPQTET